MRVSRLYANVSSETLSSQLQTNPYSFPTGTGGEAVTIGLVLCEDIEAGQQLVNLQASAIKASIGLAAPGNLPSTGGYSLQVGTDTPVSGTNVTSAISWGAQASDIQLAIDQLTDPALASYLPCSVVADPQGSGGFLIYLKNNAGPVTFGCPTNTLYPVSFVEVDAVNNGGNGGWRHILTFSQTPIAQTITFAPIVPSQPTVSELQAGGSEDTTTWNELQKLSVPPQFTGSFNLQRGIKKSGPIGLPTSADEIQTALAAIADPGGIWDVTEEQDAVVIEFDGTMGGQAQPLLVVGIVDAPAGAITFTINTDTAEMYTALRGISTQGTLALQLEIKLWTTDPSNTGAGTSLSIFRAPINFQPPVDLSSRSVTANLNWTNPPAQVSYAPFTADQILFGNRGYPRVVGDGTTTVFPINHNQASDYLRSCCRVAGDPGRELVMGEPGFPNGGDFWTEFNDQNSCTVTFAVAPAPNSVLIVITSTNYPATYQAHTHYPSDIIGLSAELSAMAANIAQLQTAIGLGATINLAQNSSLTSAVVWQAAFSSVASLFPFRGSFAFPTTGGIGAIPPASLPRLGALLPAVHAASTSALTAPLPTTSLASYVGNVYQNQTGQPVALPGFRGVPSYTLPANGYAACDGRTWYAVTNYGSGTSYYPIAFDTELFTTAIQAGMLAVNSVLSLQLGFELALLSANTNGQYVLQFEWAPITKDTTPTGVGPNLKAFDWSSGGVIFSQVIDVTDLPSVHTFGLTITRSMPVISGTPTDTLTTNVTAYGAQTGSNTGPPNGTDVFALRCYLRRWDTEDAQQSDGAGLIALRGVNLLPGGVSDTSGKVGVINITAYSSASS